MTADAVFEVIVRCTCEVVPELAGHAFVRGDRLEDLSANSIDRAEIVTMVLDSLSLAIPRIEVFGPATIGGLADLLHAKLVRH